MKHSLSSTLLILTVFGASTLSAQGLGSLKRVTAPQPSGLSQYVRDQSALVALGKALFWDMQAGSDGRTACASCHFHAGADHRAQNQLSNISGGAAPNSVLAENAFPFHVLSNPNDNRSAVVRDSSLVVGSAGVFRRLLTGVNPGSASEMGYDLTDVPSFSVNGINTRQVTTRNSPSVINAVFNTRNFWDGRASDVFTGATPFGVSDTGFRALNVSSGTPVSEAIRVTNSSLASQAVGPALSSVEMSYEGRSWAHIGKKMLSLQPLALQHVAADDSVLGAYAANGTGLRIDSYRKMIEAAFIPAYWDSDKLVDVAGIFLGRSGSPARSTDYTAAEFNFGLFWGLAIQAYEATLVSNDSRVDQFFDGNTDALSALEQQGLREFQGRGSQCTNCHSGPELTQAAFSQNGGAGGGGGRGNRGADRGFFRTGVRPISEDIGLGGLDGFGIPLSRAVGLNGTVTTSVQGLFKTPGLRNVEFTGPYQHNGGQGTLEQVIDFYSRGGDFPDGGNLGPGIQNHNFNAGDRASLLAFLKALSDDRVRYERAPFDHPELCVPTGQQQVEATLLLLDNSDPQFRLSAVDRWAGLPPVGKSGNAVPLQTFEELLQGKGSDGSRAHHLQDKCSIF